jgi:DHA3 family macrolide efflux protein-like MFS transporter
MEDWKTRFFTIWAGQQGSLLGSWVAQFGLVWWLTQETGSATVLATASLVAMVPLIALGPFTGTLVDRLPRRWLMVWVDCGIAALAGLLAFLFWAGAIRIWHIYLVMALRSAAGALHWPAMAAATSLLVPKEHLTRIAGLNQTMQGLLSIVSPPLGAIAVSLLPMYGVMGIDIFTFLFAVLPLLFLPIPEPGRGPARKTSYLSDLVGGFRYVWSWRGLFLLLCLAALLNGIAQPMATLMPLLIKDYFGKGAIELGWAESAWGIGVVLGGLLLAAWGGFKKKIHTILVGVVGMGLGFVAVGFLPSGWFYIALAMFLFAGLMNPVANSPFMALVQGTVEPGMQGRVFSLMSSMTQGMAPLSLLLAGPLADLFGVRFWYLVGGGGMIFLGLAATTVPGIMHLEESRPVAAAAEAADT